MERKPFIVPVGALDGVREAFSEFSKKAAHTPLVFGHHHIGDPGNRIISMNKLDMERKIEETMSKPLEDMPLYMEDKDVIIKSIAKERLKNGF